MTPHDYREYVESVERYLAGLKAVSTGPCPGCKDCADFYPPPQCPVCKKGELEEACDNELDLPLYCERCDAYFDKQPDPEPCCEPWFSWHSCEVCGSHLGGDRYPFHGIVPDANGSVVGGEIVHGECCEDCVYFIEYGRLDDTTMMDIAKQTAEEKGGKP